LSAFQSKTRSFVAGMHCRVLYERNRSAAPVSGRNMDHIRGFFGYRHGRNKGPQPHLRRPGAASGRVDFRPVTPGPCSMKPQNGVRRPPGIKFFPEFIPLPPIISCLSEGYLRYFKHSFFSKSVMILNCSIRVSPKTKVRKLNF
jgi:hypothetical protein